MPETAELQSRASELTTEAFSAFAEDIATMFDAKVSAQASDVDSGTIESLKNAYKKLAAVVSVSADGTMHGLFHVVFDKDGLFTLAGTFVMQPGQIIAQNRKSGTEKEAREIGDALGEVGNLLVGAWDRVFRESYAGHGHFVQKGTFIGNPWGKPEEALGIKKDEPVDILTYEMMVEPLPPFRCAVVYPTSLYAAAPEAQPGVEQVQAAAEPEKVAPPAPQPEAAAPETKPVKVDSAGESAPTVQALAGSSPPPDVPAAGKEVERPAEVQQAVPEAPQVGPISESISRITRSRAVLPGEEAGGWEGLRDIRAGDIMCKEVAWASPEETVEELIAKMQRHDTAYLLVGTNGKLEGIVSRSDIRGALSPYLQSMFAKWRTPMDVATLQIKAKWVMNRPVRTIRPDASLGAAIRGMSDGGIRCLPVVDVEGKVGGLVTVFDVFEALLAVDSGTTRCGRAHSTPPLV